MGSFRDVAIVVGSGPNGLAAAIVLARAGFDVRVIEGEDTVGGGCRSAELTLPGFVHDVCAAIHPLAAASPFLRTVPLADHGVEWIESPAALAHPFDDGSAALLYRSVDATGETLGEDAARYRRLMAPLVERSEPLLEDVLGPLGVPKSLAAFAGFSLRSALPASVLARRVFQGPRAQALFAGLAAHSMVPLTRLPTASYGLVLAVLAHVAGWPLARGGSQQLSDGLASYLRSLGGEVETGRRVTALRELGGSRPVLLDVTPRALLGMAELPARYRRRLERFRYGPGVFKLDWALDGPIPWRAPECARAATVHLGGTLDEIVASEREPWRGGVAERPYVLVAQQSLFDPIAGSRGQAHGVGVLPRPERLDRRHDRPDRGAARALCARVPGSRARPVRDGPRGDGGAQPELRGRRHQRRCRRPSPDGRAHAVCHPAPGGVPLLGVDAAGRRRPRHVRFPRRVGGASVTATGRYSGCRRRLGRLPVPCAG